MSISAFSRWSDLPDEQVTADSVYDILGAVADDVWATAACVDRILDDHNAQHALLVHGISRTDPVLERCKGFASNDGESSGDQASNQELLTRHFQQIPSDAQLCQLRAVLLERLDKLNTYVDLEKAAASSAPEDAEGEDEEEVEEEVDEWEDDPWAEETAAPVKPKPVGKLPFTCSTFLSSSLLVSARELASRQYFHALDILLRKHSSDLWPFRIDILSYIPEHAPPSEYRHLLPSLDPTNNCELKWPPTHTSTEPDFSQTTETQSAIRQAGVSLNLPEPACPQVDAHVEALSPVQLTTWYTNRVNDILLATGMVDVALTLVQHGASQGIPALDELGEELSLLSRLVYDAPQNPSSPSDWNLEAWRNMTPEAVVKAYLAHATPESVATDVTRLVIPYLFVLESRAERAGKPDPGLQERMLYEYLLTAPLPLAASIFEASKPTLPAAQRILRDDMDVARLALACLYGSESLNEWPTMSRIFECMPAWETGSQDETDEEVADTTLASLGTFVTPTTSRPKCTPKDLLLFFQPLSFQSLSRALDILDIHLESGEIFSRWSVPAPLRWFLQSADNLQEQRAWANRMARRAGGSVDPLTTQEDWEWLLDDMLKLSEKSDSGIKGAFGLLSRKEIITIFMSGLLSTGSESNKDSVVLLLTIS